MALTTFIVGAEGAVLSMIIFVIFITDEMLSLSELIDISNCPLSKLGFSVAVHSPVNSFVFVAVTE